jgi:hypothetical protein
MKLDKVALGLAAGVVWGGSVFLMTVWAAARGGGGHLFLLGQFYLGYTVSLWGALLGLVYGFIDGFLGGWVFGWLYNRFAKP